MSSTKTENAHRAAGLVYCLWLLGILFGITAVIGMFINHTRLDSVRGTHAHSHFIWQIISFWLVFGGIFLTIVLWPDPPAKTLAIGTFFIWLFSGLFGSWYLSKSRKLSFLDYKPKLKKPLENRTQNYEQIQ